MASEPPIEISGSVAGDVVGGNKTVTQTAGGDIVGGDKLTHTGSGHLFAGSGPVVVVQPAASPASARDRANQLLLLQKVRAFWVAGVLERSVHSAFLIELGRELRTDAIDHPWASVVELPETARPLPPGLSDLEVFEATGRALLILGAPGAGKTTTLLEIARDLLARAEADPAQPLPVVFNLSTWDPQRPALGPWLVAELAARYQVPRAVGRAWLADHRLLPLLDGLDEVAPAAQAACVRALNAFVAGGLAGLVVCCRADEYAQLPLRLRLNAAVALNPLTPGQIDAYLQAGGESLAALRLVMGSDEVLAAMAQTPLFLSLMCLAYQAVPLADLDRPDTTTVEQRRRHLLDQFVTRMLRRKGRRPGDAPEAVLLRWLSWLARQMNAHSLTVFASERLQPSWLETGRARWAYALLSRLGLWLALGLGISLGLNAPPSAYAPGTTLGAYLGSLFAPEALRVLFRTLAAHLAYFALVGLLAGGLVGLRLAWQARRPAPPRPAARALNAAAGVLLPVALVAALSAVLAPPLGGFTTAQVVALTLIFWVPTALLGLLALRATESGDNLAHDIPTIEALDWSWPNSLKGLVGGFVICTVAATLCVASVNGDYALFDQFFVSLALGLPVGLLGGLVGGTVLGLRGRSSVQVTPPGSWVVRYARHAVAAGLLVGLVTLLGVTTLALLAYLLIEVYLFGGSASWQTLAAALSAGLIPSLPAGFAALLYFGGAGLLQRAALRLVLVLQRRLPWRLSPLADQAENLIFLRRVGSGYLFIHRLVQDYFASLGPR